LTVEAAALGRRPGSAGRPAGHGRRIAQETRWRPLGGARYPTPPA